MSTDTQTTDPRLGHTSASNALPDSLCPGRHLAQRGIPDTPSESSESGRKIHAALAAQDRQEGLRPVLEELNLQERETFEACRKIRQKLVAQFFPDVSAGYREFREQRYWARFNANGTQYQHSGQPDFVGRSGTRCLIVDYKTLAGDVAESPENLQLRDLAVLVAGNYVPTDEVAVAIIQPFVTYDPQLCLYRKADLEQAASEMFARVVRSNDEQSRRVPGEVQCRYCKARGKCPEYQQWGGKITPPAMLSILNVPMEAWTPEQCATAASAIGPCEKLLGDIKLMLKDRLTKDVNSVPGWTLKPGALRETIINPEEVFRRFMALGGKVEQFMPAVSVQKQKLREAVNGLTGAKGKQLDAAIGTLTEGCVEASQTAPSLKRVGKDGVS